MCKHILNAQVSVRAPCCRKWFDCPECHQETADHALKENFELAFACKKCKKCFYKDIREMEESDEYCPYCDNHFVLEAKTPQLSIGVEGDDARKDARMLRDDRVRREADRTIFDVKEAPDKLG